MLPYDKYNCAEFVEMVMNDEFRKDFNFPQSEGSFFIESDQLKKNFPNYVEKRALFEDKEEGDLVMMSGKRRLCHIGLLVDINHKFYVLHSLNSIGYVSRVPVSRLQDFGLTLEGFYKWLK